MKIADQIVLENGDTLVISIHGVELTILYQTDECYGNDIYISGRNKSQRRETFGMILDSYSADVKNIVNKT